MSECRSDALRRDYNAAVANGLILRARQIERRMKALSAPRAEQAK